jgi:cellulase (glycosyl hydrolase family 5)
VAALAGTAENASGSIRTGVYDLFTYSSSTQRADTLQKTRDAGSTFAKYLLRWRNTVTAGTRADPTNPAEYNWAVPDAFVNAAKSKGLQPVLTAFEAPDWASGRKLAINGDRGRNRVNASKFHDFAVALAKHYKPLGVHYYEVWNEPNLPYYFTPQVKDGKFVSPARYRALVNAFASGIRSVDSHAIVIAGNTAPFGHSSNPAPKYFLRKVVSRKTKFDAWSTHPYTYGGPTHHAAKSGDVSLGDMGELRKILNKARRAGKILGPHKPQLWASEFSWDSKGPDSRGVPMNLLSRWISETVYRLSKAGVSTLLWFGIRDRPFGWIQTQSGFWYCGTVGLADDGTCGNSSYNSTNDARKPIFNAFRFPFVAYSGNGKVKIWGKRPAGVTGSVQIWRRRPTGNWHKVTTLGSGGGVFGKRFRSSWTSGFYQARLGSINSVPFSLKRVRDRSVLIFGCLSTPKCKPNGQPY